MSRIFFLFSLFCMFSQTAYGETAFRQRLLDEQGARPLEMAVWYPTRQTGNPELVGDNVVFMGTHALLNATPDNEVHPFSRSALKQEQASRLRVLAHRAAWAGWRSSTRPVAEVQLRPETGAGAE